MKLESNTEYPTSIVTQETDPLFRPLLYPEPFASCAKGRVKRQIGDVVSSSNFGTNRPDLVPGSCSSWRQDHTQQDEFI